MSGAIDGTSINLNTVTTDLVTAGADPANAAKFTSLFNAANNQAAEAGVPVDNILTQSEFKGYEKSLQRGVDDGGKLAAEYRAMYELLTKGPSDTKPTDDKQPVKPGATDDKPEPTSTKPESTETKPVDDKQPAKPEPDLKPDDSNKPPETRPSATNQSGETTDDKPQIDDKIPEKPGASTPKPVTADGAPEKIDKLEPLWGGPVQGSISGVEGSSGARMTIADLESLGYGSQDAGIIASAFQQAAAISAHNAGDAGDKNTLTAEGLEAFIQTIDEGARPEYDRVLKAAFTKLQDLQISDPNGERYVERVKAAESSSTTTPPQNTGTVNVSDEAALTAQLQASGKFSNDAKGQENLGNTVGLFTGAAGPDKSLTRPELEKALDLYSSFLKPGDREGALAIFDSIAVQSESVAEKPDDKTL